MTSFVSVCKLVTWSGYDFFSPTCFRSIMVLCHWLLSFAHANYVALCWLFTCRKLSGCHVPEETIFIMVSLGRRTYIP